MKFYSPGQFQLNEWPSDRREKASPLAAIAALDMRTHAGLYRSNSVTPTALSLPVFVFSHALHQPTFRSICLRQWARALRPFAATIPLPPAEARTHEHVRRLRAPPFMCDPSASKSAPRTAAVDLHLRRCNGLARREQKSLLPLGRAMLLGQQSASRDEMHTHCVNESWRPFDSETPSLSRESA